MADDSSYLGRAMAMMRGITSGQPVTTSTGVTITPQDIDTGMNLGMSFSGGGLSTRKVPTSNYLVPMTKHAENLYREMSPDMALADLPGSVAHDSSNMTRRFYSDHPDLALGQGGNKGVRVQYDAAPFEGQINKKPGWELGYQNGMSEYTAAPMKGQNIRDAVKSFEIDPASLNRIDGARYATLLAKLKTLGWDVQRSADKVMATKPELPSDGVE